MSGSVSTFELAAVLSIRDIMSNKIGEIRTEWDKLRKSMGDTSKEAKLFDSSASMAKWGAGLTVAGGAATLFAKSLIQADLETAKLESNIRSLGVTKSEMEGISSSARRMAAEMGTTQDVYLTGIYDLKSAVSTLDPKQIADVSLALDQTAKATKGEFGGLSKLFGMTYAQFKDMYKGMTDTDFAGLFGNTITLVSNLYRTDGAAMQQAMESLGSTASMLNVSFEEQSVILGKLQNTNLAGVAGTAYRDFLGKASSGMTELGLSAVNAEGKLKSMPELLASIQSRFGDSIDPDEFELLTKAFTQEGARMVSALLPKYKDLRTEINQVKNANKDMTWGDMKQAAAINMDNLSGQLDRTSAGWGSLKSLISSGFNEGPLKSIVKGLADVIGGFAAFLEKHPAAKSFVATLVFGGAVVLTLGGAILTLTGIVGMYAAVKKSAALMTIYDTGAKAVNAVQTAALSVAHVGYNAVVEMGRILHARAIAGAVAYRATQVGLSVGIGIMTVAQWALNTAFLACPLTWIIMAIVGLGAAIYGLVKYWDKVTDAIKTAWNWVKKFFGWKDEVDVDGVVADKIKKLNDQTEKLKQQQAKWDAAGIRNSEYKKNVEQIKANEEALKKLNKEMDQRQAVGGRIKELQDYRKTLEDLQKSTTKGSADFNALSAQMGYVDSVTKSLKEGLSKSDYKLTEAVMGKTSLDQVKKSGAKLAETFAAGIKSSKDVEDVVKKMVEDQIGKYLPHSDAKAGPLSQLTKSGKAFVSTFGAGIDVESKSNKATQRFVNLQAKTIKESSPVIQKITNSSRKIEAKSMVGNLSISLGGKKITKEELGALLIQLFNDELDPAGVS